MYYVYVLKSEKDKKHYIGSTSDLSRRIDDHSVGKVSSTCARRPFKLIYFEKYETRAIAEKRERFFKTGKGYEVLKNGSSRIPVGRLRDRIAGEYD